MLCNLRAKYSDIRVVVSPPSDKAVGGKLPAHSYMFQLEYHTLSCDSQVNSSRCMCECISVLSVTNFLVQIFNNAQNGAVHLRPESAKWREYGKESRNCIGNLTFY